MHYGDILRLLAWMTQAKRIVEFGILEGFSLRYLLEGASNTCDVQAYDIFEQFNGNAAKRSICDAFSAYPNVKIQEGDFYTSYTKFEDASIDILHIDIANDGSTYEFALNNYMPKVSKGGMMILEGGSKERDQIHWMVKYNKVPIQTTIQAYQDRFAIHVLEPFPSMTLVQHKG